MCDYYALQQTKEFVVVGLNAKCVITLHNGDITPKGSSSISKLASMFYVHVQHTKASIILFVVFVVILWNELNAPIHLFVIICKFGLQRRFHK